jgi:hypothetical protein
MLVQQLMLLLVLLPALLPFLLPVLPMKSRLALGCRHSSQQGAPAPLCWRAQLQETQRLRRQPGYQLVLLQIPSGMPTNGQKCLLPSLHSWPLHHRPNPISAALGLRTRQALQQQQQQQQQRWSLSSPASSLSLLACSRT